MRRLLTLSGCLVAFLAILHPAPVAAEEDSMWDATMILLVTAPIVELLVPDVRYEFATDPYVDDWVLSFPISATLAEIDFGPTDDPDDRPPMSFLPLVFGELQYTIEGEAWRGVFGARTSLCANSWFDGVYLGLYAEGGGIVATDGHGGMVGGGIITSYEGLVNLLLMYRRSFVEDLQRNDVTLNLEFPIPIPFLGLL